MWTIYHYTDATGLAGIISSKALWATDIRFLNDAREFEFGLEVFDKVYSAKREQILQNYPEFAGYLNKTINNAKLNRVFTVSFSGKGNKLSQWRGYGTGAKYNIWFSGAYLQMLGSVQGFVLTRVAYAAEEQFDHLSKVIDICRNMFERREDNNDEGWSRYLIRTISMIKNEQFSEESEVRYVSDRPDRLPPIEIRATSKGLVPYMKIELRDTWFCELSELGRVEQMIEKNCGIRKIVYGPGLPDTQKSAIEDLLRANGLNHDNQIEIVPSGIPYNAP